MAIVDRVNTTMSVWMGTTMACAQCHDHKYDPISQKEYFQFFAIFNNTEDADREDEQPVHTFTAGKQKHSVPIQRELPPGKRRTTFIQYRGNFLDRGPQVSEGVPAAFHPLPKDLPPNRLALAKWLVDENNPLTARVLANRLWEKTFGIGLVSTSEDFGTQGELPSHPELLDYLATELVASHWDIKHMIRLMVTSAAYRQSSRVTPELLERDPDNRLACPRSAFPARCGGRPRSGPGRERALERQDVRSRGASACSRRSGFRPLSAAAWIGKRARAKIAFAGRSTRVGGGRTPILRWSPSTRPAARSAPCGGRGRTPACRPW